MAIKKKDIVLMGLESTRGTVAGTFPLHHPFLGAGLVPTLTNNQGEVQSTSTWPVLTTQVGVGLTAGLAFTPDINVATVRDLIRLITERVSGDLNAISIKHSRVGVGDMLYTGCAASQLSLEYSRGSSPDAGALLQGTINFECMQAASSSGAAAGTQGTGRYFQIGRATFTVNGVAATKVLSYRRQITVAHALGPPDSTGKRLFLEDGELTEEITLVAQFTATAWSAAAVADTEMTSTSIVHATGTANETVTETMGKCKVKTHTLGETDNTTTEEITIVPHYTGAANPTVWTYGSSVGASVLGI